MKRLVFTLLFLLVAVEAHANITYVSTAGNDGNACFAGIGSPKRNIMSGLRCLTAGDILYVRGGTYTENLVFASANVPSGTTDTNRVTLSSFPGEVVTLQGQIDINSMSSGHNMNFITITGAQSNNFIVDGRSLGFGGGSGVGVCCDTHGTVVNVFQASNITVSHLEVKNWNSSNGSGGGGSSGMLMEANQVLVDSVYSHGNGVTANIDPFGGYGFYDTTRNSITQNSRFEDNRGYGIQSFVSCSPQCLDRDNNIYRFNTFKNNSLNSTCCAALTISNGHNKQVYGNVFIGGQAGQQSNGVEIAASCINCAFYNNTFYGFIGNDIGSFGAAIFSDTSGTSSSTIVNNLVYKSHHATSGNTPGSGSMHHNLCDLAETGCDLRALLSAGHPPIFTNEAAFDFTLQSGSPAINVGTAHICNSCGPSGAAVDLVNFVTTPDVGCCEFLTNPPDQTPILVACWGFDEVGGTTVNDCSTNKNNGTISGGVTRISTGRFGGALHFDGTPTAMVTVPDSVSLDVTNAFTVGMSFRPTAVHNDFRAGLVKDGTGSGAYGVYASVQGFCGNGGTIGVFGTTGSDQNVCNNTPPLQVNTWTQITVTYDHNTGLFNMYRDGGNTPVTSISGISSGTFVNVSSGVLRIGNSQFSVPGGYTEGFEGDIDEVWIYNYALSAAAKSGSCGGTFSQIQCLFNTAINVGPASPAKLTIGSAATFKQGASATSFKTSP